MVKKPNNTSSLYREQLAKLGPEDEYPAPDVIKIGKHIGEIGTPTTIIVTPEGIVVYDVGTLSGGKFRLQRIRQITQAPIHTIIYSHGHEDHIGGARVFLDDAAKRGHPRPRIIGHELLVKRLDKYKMLNGRRQYINDLQWSPFLQKYKKENNNETDLKLPDFIYPDVTFSDYFEFKLGGLTFELHHALGETDDATWVHIPEHNAVISGDILKDGMPNIGNPFKTMLRYDVEWADAMEKMIGVNPKWVLPGHGSVMNRQTAREIGLGQAAFLRWCHDEVIKLMNQGYWLDEILQKIKMPSKWQNKSYLNEEYGCLEFVIHGIYNRYGSWYSGRPTEIFPPRYDEVAASVVKVSGITALIKEIEQLLTQGNLPLAATIADMAVKGSQKSAARKKALLLKAKVMDEWAKIEKNGMAKNVYLRDAEAAENEAKSIV